MKDFFNSTETGGKITGKKHVSPPVAFVPTVGEKVHFAPRFGTPSEDRDLVPGATKRHFEGAQRPSASYDLSKGMGRKRMIPSDERKRNGLPARRAGDHSWSRVEDSDVNFCKSEGLVTAAVWRVRETPSERLASRERAFAALAARGGYARPQSAPAVGSVSSSSLAAGAANSSTHSLRRGMASSPVPPGTSAHTGGALIETAASAANQSSSNLGYLSGRSSAMSFRSLSSNLPASWLSSLPPPRGPVVAFAPETGTSKMGEDAAAVKGLDDWKAPGKRVLGDSDDDELPVMAPRPVLAPHDSRSGAGKGKGKKKS